MPLSAFGDEAFPVYESGLATIDEIFWETYQSKRRL
jgi:hypothetical protein